MLALGKFVLAQETTTITIEVENIFLAYLGTSVDLDNNYVSSYAGATYSKSWVGLTVSASEETIATIYLWIRTA